MHSLHHSLPALSSLFHAQTEGQKPHHILPNLQFQESTLNVTESEHKFVKRISERLNGWMDESDGPLKRIRNLLIQDHEIPICMCSPLSEDAFLLIFSEVACSPPACPSAGQVYEQGDCQPSPFFPSPAPCT